MNKIGLKFIGAVLTVIATALGTSACSLPVYEGKLAYQDGWNHGVIRKVGVSSTWKPRVSKDCRTEVSRENSAKWAVVELHVRTRRTEEDIKLYIVPISDESNFHHGSKVYFNIQDCEAMVLNRPLHGKSS